VKRNTTNKKQKQRKTKPMFSSIINRNARTLARIELSDERIQTLAPSVFATTPVAGVSDRYTFLPTSQIVTRMREEGWAPVEARQQAVRVEGRMGFQKHLIRFQHRDQIAKPGEYTPEIALVNSHDRSSAYQIHAALFRFVCSNGLMVSDSTVERVSIRHSRKETDEVIAASFAMLAQIPKLAERVEAFRARQLTQGEKHAFAKRAILLRWDDINTAPIGPDKILAPHRTDDSGNSLWTVYNSAQENLIRGRQRDYSQRRSNGTRHQFTRAVKGLDEDIRINKGLWELAEALRTGYFSVN
jgi:hypothetical protein